MSHDPRYLKGFELFNKGDFFEAHEVWEELWHETYDDSKDFVQGLIQVTSAFHHFSNKNLRGARILHDSGVELLSKYPANYRGIDLAALLDRFKASFREIAQAKMDDLPGRGRPEGIQIPFGPERTFRVEVSA